MDELVRSPEMNMDNYELQFENTKHLIFKPLQRIISNQKFQRSFDPNMVDSLRLWRVLRPISHIFIEEIDKLYDQERISLDLKNYIEQKGWSISQVSFDEADIRVVKLFDNAEPIFNDYHYEKLGNLFADIGFVMAHPIHKTENKFL